jgi:hypothetical protein
MLLNQIQEETMRRHAEIVVKNLETLGEYFQGTKALWQLFRGDSGLRSALPSFELVPVQDLNAKEIEQLSNTLGIHSLDISGQPADGGGESSFKESFGFIERRAQRFGGSGMPSGRVAGAFPITSTWSNLHFKLSCGRDKSCSLFIKNWTQGDPGYRYE